MRAARHVLRTLDRMVSPYPAYPVHAPSALDYFAALVADDGSFALTEAAVAVAHAAHPGLDTQSVLADIDALADGLKRRLALDAPASQKLRLLNRYFFHELGFGGNVNDYYAPANSYVHEVLRTRRGIPISLAVLYVEMASQVGLVARGVSFPGHFLIKVTMPQGEVVIDPFSGQSLSREELDERLAPYKRRQGLLGDFDMPLGLFLQAATPRDTLARMLRNLKEIHRVEDDHAQLLAVLDRLVVLLPRDWLERRDRGLVRARLGDAAGAASDLEDYLVHAPRAEDVAQIAQQAAALRAAGRPRLH
jgi:regulator of sirC expression with transglutaminase-like and TPR domain